MAASIRNDLDLIPAYIPGRSIRGAIKLASNESVIGPDSALMDAITVTAQQANRYPDMFASAITDQIAEFVGTTPNRVAVGCGSVALCQQIVQATCSPGDEVIFGHRSFEAYPILSRIAHAVPVQVPNLPSHELDLQGMLDAITDRTRVIFVCTPNNPTGTVVSPAALTQFIAAVPDTVTVVIDEAYYEYLRGDFTNGMLVQQQHENVVAVRTFSKAYGLAGIRFGYLATHPRLADAIKKMVVPFSVNSLAQAAASVCISQAGQAAARTDIVVAERERMAAELLAMGLPTPPSGTNFLWLPLGEQTTRFDDHCRRGGVLIRSFADHGCRVSVGADYENDAFLELAREFRV